MIPKNILRRFYGYYNLKKGVILFYPLGGIGGYPPFIPQMLTHLPLKPLMGGRVNPLPPSAYALPLQPR